MMDNHRGESIFASIFFKILSNLINIIHIIDTISKKLWIKNTPLIAAML